MTPGRGVLVQSGCSIQSTVLRVKSIFTPLPHRLKVFIAMLGAQLQGTNTEFRVWAPAARSVTLRLLRQNGRSNSHHEDLSMNPESGGEYALVTDATAGDRYFYLLNGDPLQMPDPVSRFLPEGVHGPTEIVDPNSFRWTDQHWHGIPFRDYIIYELHIGTFTPAGTFDSAIEKLDYLKELGITAIELMPVAAFPGQRNWGYDGVSMYAVQESYGGPAGLKRLVDAAHQRGLAVVLDVVYNHLGNEGNYLGKFGPYFTDKHQTPWGMAINFDDKQCNHVRDYIIENALYWIREYHIDGLRMDAVHAIKDDSPTHVLAELRDRVHQFAAEAGREVALVAESDENSTRYTRARDHGGYGLDGVWSDDFHHAAHTLFTGEREGYYQDYGRVDDLVKAINEGFVFQGQTFKFWGGPRGEQPRNMPLPAHVVCIQNHDQVGNRALGDRLTTLVPRGIRKLLAAVLLLAPETPLIWMGQEYDEQNPFQFFTDYGDPTLQKAVSEGRRNEFKDFTSFGSEFPDPQDPDTFEHSKLNWQLSSDQRQMLDWYRQVLCLRKKLYGEDSARTAQAQARGPQSLEMRIPGTDPVITVRAQWNAERTSQQEQQSEEEVLLSSHGGGAEITISSNSDLADELKQLCA
jgi:maltooligosyltrehalose trehalohydrolase